MSIKGSSLCGAVNYAINGSFKLIGSMPLFNAQEVSRDRICSVGDHQPGPISMGIRLGICRGVPIFPWKRKVLLQQMRAPLVGTHSEKTTEVVLGTVGGDPGRVQADTFLSVPKHPGMR